MSTITQVKKALKPLLERHQDLALIDRWLIVTPVHHVVRGVIVDRTSSADLFEPKWAVMHLCEVRRSIFLNWSSSQSPPRLYRRGLGRGWHWSDPGAILDLADVIEREALPKLRSLTTIADLMDHLKIPDAFGTMPLAGRWETQLVLNIALGNLGAARKPCAERVSKLTGDTYYFGDADDHATVRRLKELCARYQASDRQGLAALLHEWEETTVKNLKIEHLWERTPFPLELTETPVVPKTSGR